MADICIEPLTPYEPEQPATRTPVPTTMVRNPDSGTFIETSLSERNASKAGQFSPWDTPIQGE